MTYPPVNTDDDEDVGAPACFAVLLLLFIITVLTVMFMCEYADDYLMWLWMR